MNKVCLVNACLGSLIFLAGQSSAQMASKFEPASSGQAVGLRP